MAFSIIVSVYILSGIGCYFGMKRYYKTKFLHASPDFSDVVIVFVPVMNSAFALGFIGELIIEALSLADLGQKLKKFAQLFFRVER